MEKIEINKSGCWIWIGHMNTDGYGMIRAESQKPRRAHRVSFELFNGPLSKDDSVCHHCDTPACVNPSHLFKGTQADNNRDCARKGRTPKGSSHWATRLNENAVRDIRSNVGGLSDRELASHFGVSREAITSIRLKKRWKHVT